MSQFEGKKAVSFSLPDQSGEIKTNADFDGKNVVLYFYPKDNTPGCSVEADTFNKLLPEFEKHNVAIIGVSKDGVKSHVKFCDKFDLQFTLLADEELELIQAYGLWVEKSMYGRKYMGVSRETFLINSDGDIVKHYEKVKTTTHAQEVLDDVQELLG